MGDAVNVAARMDQTAAPGTVQISADNSKLILAQNAMTFIITGCPVGFGADFAIVMAVGSSSVHFIEAMHECAGSLYIELRIPIS